jgi:5-methylcytosine-specific restriction endonuclease McrA
MKIASLRTTTGIAIVREDGNAAEVLHLSVLLHKPDIRQAMDQRRNYRRRRRCANLRYRAPRFLNRGRKKGWLPPSLRSRVDEVSSWVKRYQKLVPLSAFSLETAKFDPEKFQKPETYGVVYEKGKLMGYEVREYLLEKWGRQCVYCRTEGLKLQVEHVIPKSRNGTDRVSNLTLACRKCNIKKGNQTAEEFGYPEIQTHAVEQPKDITAVSITRWAIYRAIKATGLEVEISTRGRTKYNRIRLRLPKHRAMEALCVGISTPNRFLGLQKATVLKIHAMGRGQYRRTNVDKHGFPRGYLERTKMVRGFLNGDFAKALVPHGKYAGTHEGTVLVRQSGYFDIRKDGKRIAKGINARYFSLIQRFDGYAYEKEPLRSTSYRWNTRTQYGSGKPKKSRYFWKWKKKKN